MANLSTVYLNGTAIAITAGVAHTCALLEGGYIKCWVQAAEAVQTADALRRLSSGGGCTVRV